MGEKKFLFIVFLSVFALFFVFFSWSGISWFFNYHFIEYAFEKEEPKKTVSIENSLEIKKISISVPLIIPDGTDPTLENELDQGVVYFPQSVLPGESGETIILGHSAPEGWPKIKYDWIFNDLDKLEPGDEIIVYFNNQKYVYKVAKNYIINKGEEIRSDAGDSKSILILMSCWPPGKDLKRLAVEAYLDILTE